MRIVYGQTPVLYVLSSFWAWKYSNLYIFTKKTFKKTQGIFDFILELLRRRKIFIYFSQKYTQVVAILTACSTYQIIQDPTKQYARGSNACCIASFLRQRLEMPLLVQIYA